MIGQDLIGKFVIVRTYSAGVFAAYLQKREGQEVEVSHAIRIWRWSGAASLSQLAMEGTKNPSECKFGVPVTKIILTQCIEILKCTVEAEESIKGVSSWKV
jgi:hypothetical protein